MVDVSVVTVPFLTPSLLGNLFRDMARVVDVSIVTVPFLTSCCLVNSLGT